MSRIPLQWLRSVGVVVCAVLISLAQETNKTADGPNAATPDAASELLMSLNRAKTDEERKQILAEKSALLTQEVLHDWRAQGNTLVEQAKLAAALPVFQALQLAAERMNDRALLAEALGLAGNIHMRQGRYSQALEQFQRGLALNEALGNQAGQAQSYNYLGSLKLFQGNYSAAVEDLRKSHTLFAQLNDRVGQIKTLGNLGAAYVSQGNYEQALPLLQQSLALSRAAGETVREAAALLNIGGIYLRQSDYGQAQEYFQQSLKLYESLNNQADAARVLSNLGLISYNRGDFAQALDYYRKVLPVYEKLGDQAQRISTFLGIGNVFLRQGDYEQALNQYQQSLDLSEALKAPPLIAIAQQNLGITLAGQGSLEQGVAHLQKSLDHYRALGDKPRIAASLNRLVTVYLAQGRYTEAQPLAQEGLALCEATNAKAELARTAINFGLLEVLQGRAEAGVAHYRKALAVHEDLGNKTGIGEALQRLAFALNRLGRFSEAHETAARSTAIARQTGQPDLLWIARLQEGLALYQMNQLPQARQALLESIQTIEGLRHTVAGGEREQQRFLEEKVGPYQTMVSLLAAQNEAATAFSFAEQAKARVLLDVMQTGRARLTKNLAPDEQQQERQLNARLNVLNTQIYQARQLTKPDTARLTELETRLEQARLEYETYLAKLYTAHPALKVKRGEAQPLQLAEAAALLPDEQTAFLEFAATPDKTLLFVLTKSTQKTSTTPDLKIFSLALVGPDLAARLEKFHALMQGENLVFKSEAKALYELLLKPAQAQLQGKTSLVIVPDGALWKLPFQALVNSAGRYLIETAAISYAPSLTFLRERYKQPDTPAAQGLLALGINDFGAQTSAQKLGGNDRIGNLEAAEPMTRAISKLYPPQQTTLLLGKEATEERFKAAAGKRRILHLATHGFLNDRSPMYSQIVLAPPGENAKEDGFLEAWELMNLDLKADLAILSACDTARGRIGNGEGVIGLMWALFVAGVPTTVVSQWSVDDKATEELMVEFHRQLQSRKPQSKAEALRQAGLKVMKTRPHPFNWAGFVLVGDGR